MEVKEKSIQLFDESKNHRNVFEVLKDVKKEFEIQEQEGTTVVLTEEKGLGDSESKESNEYAWSVEGKEDCITITPMNGASIAIHGKEEMWFFICCLLDCFQ